MLVQQLYRNNRLLLNANRYLVYLKSCFSEFKPVSKQTMDKIISLNNDPSHLELAIKTLTKGGVIAVPTDTIYGLAALSQDSEAIRKVYKIKGRDFNKPLAIAIPSIEQIYRWVEITVESSLLTELYQGAVTLVFNRLSTLNPALNPSFSLVGVRVPSEDFLLTLASKCPCPLALTSANKSSSESALSVQEFESIWRSIDLIFDGGCISSNNFNKEGSTVIDLSQYGCYHIIRQGCALERSVGVLEKYGLQESTNR